MQTPKNCLEPRVWYQVANVCYMTKKPYATPHNEYATDKLVTIPKGHMVMFVEYHGSTTRKCKVMYGEYVGWIFVDKRYLDHTHFFKRVAEQP